MHMSTHYARTILFAKIVYHSSTSLDSTYLLNTLIFTNINNKIFSFNIN